MFDVPIALTNTFFCKIAAQYYSYWHRHVIINCDLQSYPLSLKTHAQYTAPKFQQETSNLIHSKNQIATLDYFFVFQNLAKLTWARSGQKVSKFDHFFN